MSASSSIYELANKFYHPHMCLLICRKGINNIVCHTIFFNQLYLGILFAMNFSLAIHDAVTS